jgi:hypothetical protein
MLIFWTTRPNRRIANQKPSMSILVLPRALAKTSQGKFEIRMVWGPCRPNGLCPANSSITRWCGCYKSTVSLLIFARHPLSCRSWLLSKAISPLSLGNRKVKATIKLLKPYDYSIFLICYCITWSILTHYSKGDCGSNQPTHTLSARSCRWGIPIADYKMVDNGRSFDDRIKSKLN